MATSKTMAELEAEDAAGFQNAPQSAADKERERVMRVHRNSGAKAYAIGESRESCPFSANEPAPRAAWLTGYDNAKAQDAPEAEEPEDDEEDEDDKPLD